MKSISLGELFAQRVPGIDPQNFPDEVFDLWSIPAFDAGSPEIVAGVEIGSAKKCLEPGDVLLSKIVPHIRRAWIVTANIGRRQIGSAEWIVFRSQRVVPEYLKHFLTSDEFHSKFMGTIAGVGGSLMRARPDAVKKFEIPLPPLDEQRRIAAILDQADSLRRKRREGIRRAKKVVDELFHDLLRSEQAVTKIISLSEVSEIQVGHAFSSEEYSQEPHAIRLCRGANVLPGRLDWTDTAYWPVEQSSRYGHLALHEDDIVIAMDRPWISEGFKIARVRPEDLPALLLQRVARVRGASKEMGIFLFHLLRHPNFTRHCKPTETTVPHISPKEIRSFKFGLPPAKLIANFARAAQQVAEVEGRQTAQLVQLNALFASLQHRAFAGEL